jgi:hypothetical protein
MALRPDDPIDAEAVVESMKPHIIAFTRSYLATRLSKDQPDFSSLPVLVLFAKQPLPSDDEKSGVDDDSPRQPHVADVRLPNGRVFKELCVDEFEGPDDY